MRRARLLAVACFACMVALLVSLQHSNFVIGAEEPLRIPTPTTTHNTELVPSGKEDPVPVFSSSTPQPEEVEETAEQHTRQKKEPISAASTSTSSGRCERKDGAAGIPHGGTLQLPRLEEAVKPSNCPKRYLFVNTHTFGRHHNQLQEMMNLIIWAKRLNRTAVWGWFRHDKQWSAPTEFYDMSEIEKRFCVVNQWDMMKELRKTRDGPYQTACFGQGFNDIGPFKKTVGKQLKCKFVSGIPKYYDSRYGARVTRTFLPKLMSAAADVVVLSGEVAFFMRAGLAEHAAVFRYLRPNAEVAQEVEKFKQEKLSSAEGYFAVHLRQREKECMKEVENSFEDGKMLKDVTDDERTVIKTQCAVTVPHVHCLQRTLGISVDYPVFLASDHQNKVLEEDLVKHGAKMYTGGKFHTQEKGGLKGMAVDFFLMVGGKYFTGNQLSSITQNACFMRLGRGLGCNGFVTIFSEFHAHDLLLEPMTDISGLKL